MKKHLQNVGEFFVSLLFLLLTIDDEYEGTVMILLTKRKIPPKAP